MTSFRHAATSHVGVIRTGNEDSGYADARMLVVADGMGGHAAGELASAAVVAAVCADVSDRPTSVADFERWVRNKLDSAHSRIGDLVAEQPDRRGMGTTFTMLGSLENSLVIAHVGDSRAYRLREGKLTQLTKDHTYVQALVDSGKLDPAQAMLHPRRNLLLRTIDGIHELELDVLTNDLRIGDRYLVCSDGLNTVLTDSSILEILGQGDPTYAAATLIDYTLAAGAPDNVSVIVADVTDADEQQDAVLIGAARAQGLANATFEIGDAASWPFEDGSFDLVFSRFGVMFFGDPVGTFSNVHRALKPTGRLAFACWRGPEDHLWAGVPEEAAGEAYLLDIASNRAVSLANCAECLLRRKEFLGERKLIRERLMGVAGSNREARVQVVGFLKRSEILLDLPVRVSRRGEYRLEGVDVELTDPFDGA